MQVKERQVKERIAKRIALELRDGNVINLGIGLPTMVCDYVPKDINIHLQSENGIIGMGQIPDKDNIDHNIVNAGGRPVSIENGACFFDSSVSFAIMRGGHVDVTVLGALQVDEKGNLASHIIPGKKVPGMGGAMDLITGSKKVIIGMTHTAAGNTPKILKHITLPATGVKRVHMIVTELAVIEVTPKGLLLRELSENTTLEEVQKLTEAELNVADDLKIF